MIRTMNATTKAIVMIERRDLDVGGRDAMGRCGVMGIPIIERGRLDIEGLGAIGVVDVMSTLPLPLDGDGVEDVGGMYGCAGCCAAKLTLTVGCCPGATVSGRDGDEMEGCPTFAIAGGGVDEIMWGLVASACL